MMDKTTLSVDGVEVPVMSVSFDIANELKPIDSIFSPVCSNFRFEGSFETCYEDVDALFKMSDEPGTYTVSLDWRYVWWKRWFRQFVNLFRRVKLPLSMNVEIYGIEISRAAGESGQRRYNMKLPRRKAK